MSDQARPRPDDGGGADDDDGAGPDAEKGKCKRCERKGKTKSSFRLKKRKQKEKGISANPVSGCFGGRVVGGSGRWCCLKQPRTLESSGESPTSDPNSSEFTFDRLRALIEHNDFYSKECNPHLDGYFKGN